MILANFSEIFSQFSANLCGWEKGFTPPIILTILWSKAFPIFTAAVINHSFVSWRISGILQIIVLLLIFFLIEEREGNVTSVGLTNGIFPSSTFLFYHIGFHQPVVTGDPKLSKTWLQVISNSNQFWQAFAGFTRPLYQ